MESKLKDKFESTWMYSESHPYRLWQHITLRGVFIGTAFGCLGGIPFGLIRKHPNLLQSVGKYTLRGGIGGGALFGLMALERLYHLDSDGIGDRSYRLCYNWSQNKWDIACGIGALLGGAFLKNGTGSVLRGGAVGIVFGTATCSLAGLIKKFSEGRKEKTSN